MRCVGEPSKISLCHCLECQRRTGGLFGVAAFFDMASTEVVGESSVYQRPSDSGFAVEHHFCPQCGSTVFWYPSRKAGVVAVAVGCFSDPSFPQPSQAVHSEHCHEWLSLPDLQ